MAHKKGHGMKHHAMADGMGMHMPASHVKHHLAMEHAQHGSRLHHEADMHSRMGGPHGTYRHEVEKPMLPHEGHLEHSMGCSDFKGQSMDIAYGQAGMQGCKSDGSKIVSQFKDYHWSGASGDSSGY